MVCPLGRAGVGRHASTGQDRWGKRSSGSRCPLREGDSPEPAAEGVHNLSMLRTAQALALLSFLAFGCARDESSVTIETPTQESATDTKPTPPALADSEVYLACVSTSADEGMPAHDVMLHLGGRAVKVGASAACAKLTSEHHGIPDTALSAVGGWWAGGGDYFYVEKVGSEFVVKLTYDEESSGEHGGTIADPKDAKVVARYSLSGEELQAPKLD